MKGCSCIPTWTLQRRTSFAKSAIPWFLPFYTKRSRGVNYFYFFIFFWFALVIKVKSVAKVLVSSADSDIYYGNTSPLATKSNLGIFWKTNTSQITHFCPLHCERLPISLIKVFFLAQNLPADTAHLTYCNYPLQFGRRFCVKLHQSELSGSFAVDFSKPRVASIIF